MAGTYIPLIKRTKWVDLSNEHKKLRETVESDLKEGCNKGNIQPIMLQGAQRHRNLVRFKITNLAELSIVSLKSRSTN